MDELDLKILRSLISERVVSPSNPSVKLSLRAIAAHLGASTMADVPKFLEWAKSQPGIASA